MQDEMADRAWASFEEFFRLRMMLWERRENVRAKESALHAALSNLTVKAWDAREKARPGIEVPGVISKLRGEVRKRKAQSPKHVPAETETETPPQQVDGVSGGVFTDSFAWMDQHNVGFEQNVDLGQGVMHGIMVGQDNSSVGMGLGWDFWNDLMPMNGNVDANGQEYSAHNMYST